MVSEAPVDAEPPVTTASVMPPPNAAGWNNSDVTVTLVSADNAGGSGVNHIMWSATGAQAIASTSVAGSSISVSITGEGETTLTFFASDGAGNVEVAKTVTVRLDKTPPAMVCSSAPGVLWPPNHKLVAVTTAVSVTDSQSGSAGFVLQSAVSNEPDNGLGDGDTTHDVVGWDIGTPDVNGWLRAERSGLRSGRLYTLSYAGIDRAGNAAHCTTTVSVPHDQR